MPDASSAAPPSEIIATVAIVNRMCNTVAMMSQGRPLSKGMYKRESRRARHPQRKSQDHNKARSTTTSRRSVLTLAYVVSIQLFRLRGS